MFETALNIIKIEEGFKDSVYLCSEGYPTVGYGVKLGYKNQPLSEYRDFPKLPENVASLWLSEFLSKLVRDLKRDPELSYIFKLDDVRGAVCLSMCYQLGISGFKKFKQTNKYLKEGNYQKSSEEMLDSLWANQTSNRANRHSSMILTGEILAYYCR